MIVCNRNECGDLSDNCRLLQLLLKLQTCNWGGRSQKLELGCSCVDGQRRRVGQGTSYCNVKKLEPDSMIGRRLASNGSQPSSGLDLILILILAQILPQTRLALKSKSDAILT